MLKESPEAVHKCRQQVLIKLHPHTKKNLCLLANHDHSMPAVVNRENCTTFLHVHASNKPLQKLKCISFSFTASIWYQTVGLRESYKTSMIGTLWNREFFGNCFTKECKATVVRCGFWTNSCLEILRVTLLIFLLFTTFLHWYLSRKSLSSSQFIIWKFILNHDIWNKLFLQWW